LAAPGGRVDHPGPAARHAEAKAIAAVERIGRVGADPSEAREAGDEESAANLVRALVPADESAEPAGADVGHVGRTERKHCPAAVAVLVVHSADRGNPPCSRAIIARRQHGGDEVRRILCELLVGSDQSRRSGDEGPRRLFLKSALADAEQVADRGETGGFVLADISLTKLPGVRRW